jgi:hypothetical protein
MKRHRYHLTPHAKDETIPLRTGVIPKGNKVFLDEIEIDDDGTAQQTKGQRDAGNYHILANVWLSEFGEERLPGRWRLVTVEPDQDFQDPPIFTLLPPDRSSARSEANLTDYLNKERKKDDRTWLSPEYIAKTLHPLLMAGAIRDHNDLASHINERMMKPVLEAKDAAERQRHKEFEARAAAERERDLAKAEKDKATQAKEEAERHRLNAQQEKNAAELQWEEEFRAREAAERARDVAKEEKQEMVSRLAEVTNERDQMAQALAKIREGSSSGEAPKISLEVARQVTKPWPSRTGSDYMNIGIEATIDDVRQIGSKISLTYLDRSGNKQTVSDFGYHGFVQLVYDYLMSCKTEGRRAVFILTYRPDMKMRLAADTMMLANYVNLWRK